MSYFSQQAANSLSNGSHLINSDHLKTCAGSGRKMVIALSLCALTLAGCQSSRIGALNTQPIVAPLPAAPAGNIQQNTLPPVGQSVGAGQFPSAPIVETAPETEIVGIDPNLQPPTITTPTAPANAAPVTREALVGAWKVSTGGSSCQVFMALTQWTGGYRAASRGCPGDAAKIAAWDVSGSQVVLKDSTGNTVARLFSSSDSRYDGSTSGGQAISLSR